MKPFLDEDFLLQSGTAKELYRNHAERLPIIDYHCHIEPGEIAQNRRFDNLAQLWLDADHYKWRLMRANGVPEHYITGSADGYEKFLRFAEVMPKAVGHPVYHWAHLELRRYFGCELTINKQNANAIWEATNKPFFARDAITKSNVKVIVTTDDPVDSLEWHKSLRGSFETAVLPCFRPDAALCPENAGYAAYIEQLGISAGMEIRSFDNLCEALEKRAAHFNEMGCRASDHGIVAVPCRAASQAELDGAFQRARDGKPLDEDTLEAFKTALLSFLGGLYARYNWVMQLHYGAVRNVNSALFASIGVNTGLDCIAPAGCGAKLVPFLNMLASRKKLPKTVVFSLDPNDNAMLDSAVHCFNEEGLQMQHGPAWWFNDTKTGMEEHLTGLASFSLLGNFIGMLTDSRSFLSYIRHEYFRRILCNLIGSWAENGEIPCDMGALGTLVSDISYNNAVRYFGF